MNCEEINLKLLIEHTMKYLEVCSKYFIMIDKTTDKTRFDDPFMYYDHEYGVEEWILKNTNVVLWGGDELQIIKQCLSERIDKKNYMTHIVFQLQLNHNTIEIDNKEYELNFSKDSTIDDLEQCIFETSLLGVNNYFHHVAELTLKYLYHKEFYNENIKHPLIISTNNTKGKLPAWYDYRSIQ